MSEKKAKTATIIGLIVNIFLFGIKLIAALMSGSLAILSDALNSFTDIITSIAIVIAVKMSNQKADEGHPFGHHRAEPLAGLLVAIMAGILGFEIIKRSIINIIQGSEVIEMSYVVLIILIISIVIKLLIALQFRSIAKKTNSPALSASYIDYRNDIMVSVLVLLGFLFSAQLPLLDTAVASMIGLYILYSGYMIGARNIEYLMGSCPNKETLRNIGEIALAVNGVKGVNEINAHYVGNFIHVEVHIEVNKHMNTKRSHHISKLVQWQIESIENISKAFIHVDPV